MYGRVLQRMRASIRGRQYVMTVHAWEEMENDGLSFLDVENAILSGHDFILLGLRGQAKTRILRGLATLLDTFHFSEDVEILGPETFACVSVVGQIQGEPAGVDMVVPGKVTGTIDLIGPDATTILTANDLLTGSPDLLEARRIADGVPRFLVDFTAANLVQEAGLEAAVSFDKGCYLGQETVARLHYRGRPNRRLCGVALDGPATAGASLFLGERAVGVLTSVADDPDLGRIGLAILRREVAAGDQLQVDEGGTSATVVALPFTERS